MNSIYFRTNIEKANKLINQYILQSRRFIEYACFPYGRVQALTWGEIDCRYAYDFQYFAFTKSTKSLISIRQLLKLNNNEDVLILLRSIFENYLASRYFIEKVVDGGETLIDDFIFIPMFLAS